MRSMWTTIDGVRIHSLAGGEGPPVVLVHGYGLSGAYMLPLARALAGSCTAYAPDLPGQGKSDALRDRIEERLPELAQPAVVVWGERDGFVGRAWAERVAALLPRGRLVVVPGEPHAVHYTRPAVVADVVLELLAEESEDLGGHLLGRFEHGNVAARDVDDAGGVEHALPLVGDPHRHQPVAVAPEQ